jgi:hypothetical protein
MRPSRLRERMLHGQEMLPLVMTHGLKQFASGWKVLQHSVRRADFESTQLVGVAIDIMFGSGNVGR